MLEVSSAAHVNLRKGRAAIYERALQLERELAIAQARIAELEKDAARYRKLKAAITVPMAMQSFLKHMGWHPDTFEMGIDEAIDAALKTRA